MVDGEQRTAFQSDIMWFNSRVEAVLFFSRQLPCESVIDIFGESEGARKYSYATVQFSQAPSAELRERFRGARLQVMHETDSRHFIETFKGTAIHLAIADALAAAPRTKADLMALLQDEGDFTYGKALLEMLRSGYVDEAETPTGPVLQLRIRPRLHSDAHEVKSSVYRALCPTVDELSATTRMPADAVAHALRSFGPLATCDGERWRWRGTDGAALALVEGERQRVEAERARLDGLREQTEANARRAATTLALVESELDEVAALERAVVARLNGHAFIRPEKWEEWICTGR